MVDTIVKFICGMGAVHIHYCRFCGAPYLSFEETEECERMHSGHPEEGAATNQLDDAHNIIQT